MKKKNNLHCRSFPFISQFSLSPNEKAPSTVSYLADTRLQHTVRRQQGYGILTREKKCKSEGLFDPQKFAAVHSLI